MDTPDTSFYMNLGYGLFFVVMIIYVASMYLRYHNLKRDLETLDSIKEDDR